MPFSRIKFFYMRTDSHACCRWLMRSVKEEVEEEDEDVKGSIRVKQEGDSGENDRKPSFAFSRWKAHLC